MKHSSSPAEPHRS
uniref:Uncharacterized protein n=1 Tax=Arundo donax TaxID=35708 RepID=A0A0A9FM58_ARUDO